MKDMSDVALTFLLAMAGGAIIIAAVLLASVVLAVADPRATTSHSIRS